MTFIENVVGAVVNVGTEGNDLWAIVKNSKFYGETDAKECSVQNECKGSSASHCEDRTAMFMSYFSLGGKPPMVKKKT